MKSTVEALQSVYLEKGGALTDTYPDIANGAPVGDYVTIPDMISAFVAINAATGRSGGGVVYVTINGITTDNQTITFDKASMNAGEIANAVKAGNVVIIRINVTNTVANMIVTQMSSNLQFSEVNGTISMVAVIVNASEIYAINANGNVAKDS